MVDVVRRTEAQGAGWPITEAAEQALRGEIDRLSAELGAPGDGTTALVVLDRRRLQRRLEQLTAILADVRVPQPGAGAIGRRVTIIDEDGAEVSYAIVLPGDGDPALGWLSADSPLGAALMGCRAGDRATVEAPGGAWSLDVVRVD